MCVSSSLHIPFTPLTHPQSISIPSALTYISVKTSSLYSHLISSPLTSYNLSPHSLHSPTCPSTPPTPSALSSFHISSALNILHSVSTLSRLPYMTRDTSSSNCPITSFHVSSAELLQEHKKKRTLPEVLEPVVFPTPGQQQL